MNDKLKEFYSVLQQKNFKLPEYDVFATELENPERSQALYEVLGKKNFKLPEYDVFVNELGLKKKGLDLVPGTWENIKNVSKTFSTIAGDIPELEEKAEPVEEERGKPMVSFHSDLKYPHWSNVSKALGIPISKEIEKLADFYGVKVSDLGEPAVLKSEPDTLDDFLGKVEIKKDEIIPDQTRVAMKLAERPVVNLDDYFRKRNVNPEDLGLSPDVNTERWLGEGEKEKLDKILIDKGLYKPPDTGRKSYAASVAKGFNEGMANMIRDISYLSGLAKEIEKLPLKAAAKITGVEKRVPSETLDKYYEQLLNTARPNLGATADDYESIAKWLENIGGDVVPDDRLGAALRNTGHFIPDLMAMTFLPEAKIPLLAEYGLRGTFKFPAYLGFKSYVEAAKEGEGVAGAAQAGAKGVLAGLEYGAIGIEGKQLAEIAKSFGAGVFKTSAVEALANSLGFAAVTKAEGGDVLQGALEGLTFYGLGKIKDIPKDMTEALNRRVFNSYLTATDNNIRYIAQMQKDFNPDKARQESLDFTVQILKEKDFAKREELVRKKNAIDNVINISAATNLVLKYPDKFINIIKDSPLISEREKKVWINRFSRTIEDTDPRIQEAKPMRDEINNLKSEMATWKDDLSVGEDVRTDKIKAINTRIEELQKGIDKVMAKPLEDYMPKPPKKTEKKEEEVAPEEKLTLEGKEFATKEELFKYLDETAIDKKTKGIKEGWMEGKEIPDTETLKAINKWEATKKKTEPTPSNYKKITPEEEERLKTGKISKAIKKGSRTYKALQEPPGDFTDSVMQFFINGGRISREDFISHSGWGSEDIKKSGIGFLLSKEGQKIDVFHEAIKDSFGMEEKGPMDMINKIIDIMRENPTRGKMLDAFERRRKIEQPFEPTEEEIAKQETDEKLTAIIKKNGGLNERAMQEAADVGLISKEELNKFKEELENENAEQEQRDREWSEEEARIEYERRGEEIPPSKKPGEGEEKPVEDEGKISKQPTEKGEKPKLIVPPGTPAGEGKVTGEGKEELAKPKPTEVQQKQIDAINKDYNEQIVDRQNELDAIPKKIIKAINEANKRIGLFGDLKPEEADEILKRDEQGFKVTSETIDAIRKPFLEREAELRKEIDALNKERESKIGEVMKQMNLFTEKPLSEQRMEGLGIKDRTWRAKNKKAGNEIKTDTKEDAEKLAFREPLPMALNEDPNYKNSDLNNALKLTDISRNLIQRLGRKLGGGVRFGLLKRFARKAEGLFFPDSGIVRFKGLKDFRTLCHEIGHWIDFYVFDMRGVVGAKNLPEKYPEIASELRTVGEKYKGRIYRDLDKIKRDEDSGFMKPDRANILRAKLTPQLKARDTRLASMKKKYGEEIVAGVLQRDYFQKELKDFLIDINFPMSQRKKTEAIAEFIYNYTVKPEDVVKALPKFHAWFEKLLETAPPIKDALMSAREEFKDYNALDARAKRYIEIEKKEPWLEGLIKSWDPDKLLYSWVNHLQYMKNLSEDWRKIVGGTAQSYKDPFLSAKSMMGIDGRAQQWLLHHPYFHRGADYQIRKDIEGLIPILKPIIGKKEYGDWSDYLLAKDSMESYQNKRPKEAPIPLDLAKEKIRLYEEQYGVRKLWDFQAKVQAYNETLLDFYAESGKISKEAVELIKSRHQYYVPLRRVFEEFEVRKGAAGTGRDILATSEKAIWKRLGSERNVRDIFASMIENTYNILSSGEHNMLNANTRDALFAIQDANMKKKWDKFYQEGSLIQEIPGLVMKPYYDVATASIKFGITREAPIRGKILTVWEDGKPRYYDVDADLYNNLFQHEPKVVEIIRKLSAPSRWLQAGAVVYDPTFPVRNIIRDQISARFYSNHGYSPADFIEGIFSAIKKDDIFQKWMASGGDQSFLTAADKLLEKGYAEKRIGRPLEKKWKSYRKNPLLALQDFSRLSEIGTRLGAFKNAYKKTRDANLAAIESRDVSADYGVHGAMIRNILPLYPFLNARTQHTARITEVMKKHPVRFFMRGMEIASIGVLNWLVNNQDEESRKLYQSLPEWRKWGMFNIRIPGTDHFFPMPKGFLGMLFASSAESALDWAVNDDPVFVKDFATELFKEYSPIGSGSELFPHIAKIPMELISNKVGYTGKPIIPESLKLLEKEEQYLDSTPEIFKAIGKGLNISPLRLNYLVRNFFGGAGIGAVNILDETLQAAGLLEDKPDDLFTVLSRMPFTKAFLTESPLGPYSAQVGDFYETLDKITKLNRTITDYVEKGNFTRINQIMEDPEKERMYVFYEGNSYAINKFREVMSGMREYKIANLKDDLITKDAARRENDRVDRLIHETAIQFKDAWEKDEPFNLNKELQDIMDKMGKEEKETREEVEQFKNTYNPYWLQLREQNKGTYDLLREYNGLKDLQPTRKIKDNMTGENVTLKFQNARRFNEELVVNYAKEVENIIGKTSESFKRYDYPSEANPEQTELDRLLDVAWSRASDITRNTFKLPKE